MAAPAGAGKAVAVRAAGMEEAERAAGMEEVEMEAARLLRQAVTAGQAAEGS